MTVGKVMKTFERTTYASFKKDFELKNWGNEIESSCCICLIDYDGSVEVIKTVCNHVFHEDCLKQCIEQKYPACECPFCRTKFEAN